MSKKKPRRSKIKYPALERRMNTRIRQEYTDLDYVDKLDDTEKKHELPDGTKVTEKEWMNYFMKEWNNGSIAKDSIKDKTGEAAKKNKFHRTPQEAKQCTDRNNSRNNDVYGVAKARNRINDTDIVDFESRAKYHNTEDDIIELLDYIKESSESTDNTDN